MGPYWKLQPVACKVNMELKFEFMSVNKDNSHSWVTISRDLNKLVTDLNNNEQETVATIPIGERTWTDVEPGKPSLSDYPVSKKLIYLLRHGSPPRDNDGAIEFWRIKDNLQKHFLYYYHWSDEKWKSSMTGGGGQKKIFQYCSDSSGTILYFRALQGHSGRSLIDPSLQDNVIIPDGFFEYIYHIGCASKSIYTPSQIHD